MAAELAKTTGTALDLMRSNAKQFERAIADSIPFEWFMQCAMSAVRSNPKLRQCTAESVLSTLMGFAQMSLVPNTPLGQAYMIPFRNHGVLEATPIIGYKGYVAMAYRSARVGSVHAHVVYENDQFSVQYGTSESIHHVPASGDRGKMIGAYAGFFIDGRHPVFRYMPEDKILAVRPAKWQGTPWNIETAVSEMYMKTPLRRVLKLSPHSPQLSLGITIDEATDRGARVRWTPDEGTWIDDGDDDQGAFPETATAAGLSGNGEDAKKEPPEGKTECFLCGEFFAPDELEEVRGKPVCKTCQKEG